MTRKEANMEIIRLLVNYINMAPHQRLGQVLRNTGVVRDYWDEKEQCMKWANHFNEEPWDMIERIKETLNK